MRRALLLIVLLLCLCITPLTTFAQCSTPSFTPTPTPTYSDIVTGTASSNLISYWKLDETSGTTAADSSGHGRTGTYSGVTLNATTFVDGTPVASWDGVNDSVNIYGASLAAAFNKDIGSVSAWIRVGGASDWTDGQFHVAVNLEADNNNRLSFRKPSTNNLIGAGYVAGGTVDVLDTSSSSTGWLHIAGTWNKTADTFQLYLSGSAVGSASTLGTWSGTIASTLTTVGARGAANYWRGNIAHVALWDTALSSGQISTLSSVPIPSTATPTVSPTCTPIPTSDYYVYQTVIPQYTGTPGQLTRFDYVTSAGGVQISNVLSWILFTMWGAFLFGIFFLRKRSAK